MRKKATRREAMTVGLGAVVLGAAGEAAGAEAKAGSIEVGHHYKRNDVATFHITGTGTNWKPGKVKVDMKGTTADGKDVTWNHDPLKQNVVNPTLIRVMSAPTWTTRSVEQKKDDPGDHKGLGSLTVTVSNDDGSNPLPVTLATVTYIT